MAEPGRAGWRDWLLLMGAALALRLAFYTGFFGSDEVTYTESAFNLLHGNWSVDEYVGANRYGVNLPVAGFALLFGQNEFAAALYSLVCSLAEVALVFGIGRRMIGTRAALLGAAVLAFLPIHVHSAGRLMADAPLALAITASFLCFWLGEARGRSAAFACAGLAAGFAFWIKPHAMIYLLVFLTYPLVFRRWNWQWGWMVVAFVVVVLANCLLFWALTGNPLFLIDAMRARQTSGYLESGMVSGEIVNSPWYYLNYLFLRVYHTWLAAYAALFAIALWMGRRSGRSASTAPANSYLVWWGAGLVLLFSLFVVSWRPLVFIPKQTNYMLIFVAPLCLLAGDALARLKGGWLVAVGAMLLVPSVLLSAMQQSSIRTFTANSKAAVAFARSHPERQVFATSNAYRAARFDNLVRPAAPVPMHPLEDLVEAADGAQAPADRYAIVDSQTLQWGSKEPIRKLSEVPSCWVPSGVLDARVDGAGYRLVASRGGLTTVLPSALAQRIKPNLDALTRPAPAYLFKVPAGCRLPAAGVARREP
jgi:4-amino-4-deoxy-L-arabinose transferase-like glycosyltransferase